MGQNQIAVCGKGRQQGRGIHKAQAWGWGTVKGVKGHGEPGEERAAKGRSKKEGRQNHWVGVWGCRLARGVGRRVWQQEKVLWVVGTQVLWWGRQPTELGTVGESNGICGQGRHGKNPMYVLKEGNPWVPEVCAGAGRATWGRAGRQAQEVKGRRTNHHSRTCGR